MMFGLVLMACPTGTNALAADKALSLAISAYRPEAVMLSQWRPLADYLEHRLPGYCIKVKALEPEALERAAHRGELDLVFTNPAHYIAIRSIEQMQREGRLTSPVKILNRQDLSGFPFALSTDLYPEWPLVALPSTGEVTGHRIASALLALQPNDPAAQAAGITGFTIPADYASVEQVMRTNRMPPFEHLPPIGWDDLWGQHRFALVATPAAFTAILALTLWLILSNRYLAAERSRALTLGKRLEREHAHLETLVQTIPDLVWLKDPDGVYLACNPRFEAFFGSPRQQIIGKTDYDFMARDAADLFRGFDRRAMRTEGPCTNEEWVTFAQDGHRELLETTKVAMRDANGDLIGILGIGHDITERQRTEQDLRAITEFAAEGIWTSQPDGRYLYANPAALAMTEHTLDELRTMTIADLVWPDEREHLNRHLAKLRIAGTVDRDFWKLRRKDGGQVEVEVTSQQLPDERLLAIGRDFSHLRAHQDALFRAIYYDALTGLPNRTLTLERLEQSLLRTRRDRTHLALSVLDLDHFGAINERFGHEGGDRLLADIAQRLQSQLRSGDTLARVGGDEFALLMDDLAHPQAASSILDRLLTTLAAPIPHDGGEVIISASLGLTVFPEDDEDPETLLRHATQAMYRAKELGRDRMHQFDVEQDRALVTHMSALQRLRTAIEHNELLLHYQPKVDLKTADPIGTEALIRWQQPERGLLFPADFLAQADGTELEIRLSEWVIEHALVQMVAWQAQGLALSVSINLPAAHLLLPGFAEWLAATLARHPTLSPGSLEIEILESAAIADMHVAVSRLTALKATGVVISLDDFGTGFSSLAYLRRLPVDTLKIDRSFVSDMLEDPSALGVVEHVIRLAKIFGHNVIAEGVETMDDWLVLRQLGCDQGQGYGIARPMPPDAIPAWLNSWHLQGAWRNIPTIEQTNGDATLIVAGIMHHRWVRTLTAALAAGASSLQGIESAEQCPFGKWYPGLGQTRFGALPDFKTIDALHHRVHAIADALVDDLTAGRQADVQTRLPELHSASLALLEQIERLALGGGTWSERTRQGTAHS